MSIVEFLTFLAELDIRLWVEDDNLRYSAAEGVFTDDIKKQVVARKSELIDFLSQAKKTSNNRIPVLDRNQRLPLSFAQQRLWFLNQLEPDNAAYNMPSAIRISGTLRIDVLERVFTEIVRRHEILRTVYREDDEQPEQVIKAAKAWNLPLEELNLAAATSQGSAEEDAETQQLMALSKAEAGESFDLENGPIMRSRLLRLREADYLLLITIHHIACDGWSMGILVSEIVALYCSYCNDQSAALPEPTIAYADYAHWQTQQLNQEALEVQLEHWRPKLQGVPVLQLPTDKPRPTALGTAGKRIDFRINRKQTQQINELCQSHDATQFMLMLSVFNVLLHRLSQQEDFCVGIPIANRSNSALDSLVGCFVNTLALRSQLVGNPSFSQFLAGVKKTATEGFNHQDIPFERVVDELAVARDMSHTPIFQVMFTMQNVPADGQVHMPDVELEILEFQRGTAQFELTLTVAEKGGRLYCGLEYNTDLFSEESAERFIVYFQRLVSEIIADPSRPIGHLPMLDETERNQLLNTWNDTRRDIPDCCVHEMIERQVKRTPDAIAVACGDDQLSYQALNNKANKLAYHLIGQGLNVGDRVGICLQASTEVLVALLAVQKAGGAYVPMDPNYPRDRLAHIISNAQISLLLTQQALLERLPNSGDTQLIEVDAQSGLWQSLEATKNSNPKRDIEPQDLFYVVYTSGSTGMPKGAGVRHECEVNLLNWYTREYTLGPTDNALIISALGFDLTQKNLFALLTVGGTVVFPSTSSYDDRVIVADIVKHDITMINCAPSAFYPLVEHTTELSQLDSLRVVLFGGEPIHLENLARWITRPQCQSAIVNMYGPTECTDISSSFRMDAPVDYIGKAIPIGRPNDNVKLYVLDHNQQLVPTGVAGELCVGGASVGNGYLNNPELTAQSFIPSPYGEGKIYRTGDLVRQLRDGNIEFIDRIDAQVKIRGFRIELSEIESQLNQHSGVRESVVNAIKDESNNTILIAYAVSDADLPASAELRAFLKKSLPDFMIPALVMPIDSIPLTPNGKVNRNALPVPEGDLRSTEYVAPRNEAEEKIASIWREVLSVDKVGVHDNFFELGGHSLLATRVAARLRETFAIDLALKDLFDATTIAGLATAVMKAETQQHSMPVLAPIPRGSLAPEQWLLSFSQQRLWVLDNLQKGSPMYNIPMAVQLSGQLDTALLQKALDGVVERHEVLRTSFSQNEKGSFQIIHATGGCELLQQQLESEADIKSALAEFAMQAFDLSQGPLIRAQLIQHSADDGKYLLMVNMHHIASDGWSINIFLRELMTLYQAFVKGLENPLPALDIQYADFALWQREWLSGNILDTQVDYWRGQLAHVPVLQLPTDRPRPPMVSAEGQAINFEIDSTLSAQLRELSQKTQSTLFMTLLAAFQVLLYRASGQEDFCIGSPVANRAHPKLENLIGFFINTLALRTEIDANESFSDLLARVKQNCLDAYDHQDLPFERLVDVLNVPRNMSHTPLFQVMFSMQTLETADQSFQDAESGLSVTPLQQSSGSYELPVKFDLQLALTDSGDAIAATLEFRRSLFDTATIERFAEHLVTLLRNIVDNPAQAVNAIALIPAEQSAHLLATDGDAWNATRVDYPPALAIHHLFEEQVVKTPNAVAICDENESWTYQTLNERANQLAHYLREQHQIGSDSLVGVCMERSLDMSLALIAILKAGGAYVPFDPSFPQDRLGFMLEDTRIPVMLTQSHLRSQLPYGDHAVLMLDTQSDLWSAQERANIDADVVAGQLFNVIFTSGSTGKPKGVMVPHQGIINRLLWMQSAYSLDHTDRVLQKTPYSFDVSVWELFWPLIVGAQLVYAKPEGHKSPEYLRNIIQQQNISTLHFVPSMLGIFLQTDDIEACNTVKRVFCSGEALQLEHERRFFARLPQVQLHNLYGPTEASVDVSYFACGPDSDYRSIPIGKPVSNTQLHVLDEQLQPVPVGIVGELYIGGVQLARGYLNRETLTRETFIDNPYHTTGHPSARLYKTGDLARYLADGNIEYVGRVDFQVKVRGLRIELGEIESALHRHERVKETIVITKNMASNAGDSNVLIIAYIVPEDQDNPPENNDLRKHLRSSLPEYMVPNAFMMLQGIPLSANGKANRKALPEPQMGEQVSTEYIEPGTDIEIKLAAIWAELLNVDKVGIEDNFFELGGHSMLAMQAAAQAHAEFEVDIELTKIFETPTVAAIAELVDTAITEQGLLMDDSQADEDDDDEFVI